MDYPISVPSIGLVGGKFVDEDPLSGTPGSLIPSAWGNAITDEVLNAITGAGLVPDESNNTQLLMAIRLINKQAVLLADTGVVNAYAAANSPALTALPAKGYVQRVVIAQANTGPATYAPDGLAPKPIYGLGLQPLQGGELAAGVAVLMYLVQADVNGGNGAWVIIESLGGATQVAPATQSRHAMQLGQAIGRIISLKVFPSNDNYLPSPGMRECIVIARGGGASSGGSAATTANQYSVSGGGGQGATAVGKFTAAEIGSGKVVTIGLGGTTLPGGNVGVSGGTTSVGSLISASGGFGSNGKINTTATTFSNNGGDGGSTTIGGNIYSSKGSPGSPGLVLIGSDLSGGNGGGEGGGLGGNASTTSGNPGMAPGAGGGGISSTPSQAAKQGGPGANGIAFIVELS